MATGGWTLDLHAGSRRSGGGERGFVGNAGRRGAWEPKAGRERETQDNGRGATGRKGRRQPTDNHSPPAPPP